MLAQVTQLMHDHVLHHGRGHHHQPPGEIQRAFRTARAPAGAGPGDADGAVFKAVLFGKELHTPGNILAGLSPVPGLERGGGVLPAVAAQAEAAVEGQGFPLLVDNLQRVGLPQEEKALSGLVQSGLRLALPQFGAFLLDPALFLGKNLGDLPVRGAQRGAHYQGPIGLDNQGVGLAPGADDLIGLHGFYFIRKQPAGRGKKEAILEGSVRCSQSSW